MLRNMVVVYVIDVGSPRVSKRSPGGALGWARATHGTDGEPIVTGGAALAAMIDAMHADADAHLVATLGIESPLWIPVPREDAELLATGRKNEGSRSCFAPAGGYVTALGMHELAHIVPRLPKTWAPTLQWQDWQRDDPTKLLIWEAFVTGAAHSKKDDPHAHARDAATAAVEMLQRTRDGALKNDVEPDPPAERGSRDVLSIAGAVLLWSGYSTDLNLLRAAPLVVRPGVRFEGAIAEVSVPANGSARRGTLP